MLRRLLTRRSPVQLTTDGLRAVQPVDRAELDRLLRHSPTRVEWIMGGGHVWRGQAGRVA
jgi:hypothetical protein